MPVNPVEVKLDPPVDRSEFWRDVEACRRAHSPAAAARFAYSLIRRQAFVELDRAKAARGLTLIEIERRLIGRVRELWYEAVARGDLEVTAYHYEMKWQTEAADAR